MNNMEMALINETYNYSCSLPLHAPESGSWSCWCSNKIKLYDINQKLISVLSMDFSY